MLNLNLLGSTNETPRVPDNGNTRKIVFGKGCNPKLENGEGWAYLWWSQCDYGMRDRA
jgi:hypothetical protein